MKSPLHQSKAHVPPVLNPHRAMPAVYFDRSVDRNPGAAPGGGGGGGITPPLYLAIVDPTHVKVTFGQVSGITPSGGWAGGGNDVGVSVDISGYAAGTWNIYMHCTLGADGHPTAVTVLAATSAVPADDSTNAYRLIGQAVIAGGIVTSVAPSMAWSQEFVTCGRDSDDPATTPGLYYWQVA